LKSLDPIQRAAMLAHQRGESLLQLAAKLEMTTAAAEQFLAATSTLIRRRLQNLAQGEGMKKESSKGACIQAGCANIVQGRVPERADLRPYCALHRRLRADVQLPKPDAVGAARLVEAKQPTPDIVQIGPALALGLLDRSAPYRRLSEPRVHSWESDMAANAWLVNNQGIGIDSNGLVFDGQHRLWGIARSGRTVPLLVASGLDPRARETVDSGRVRSTGDQLDILDGGKSGTRRAAWMRSIDILELGYDSSVSTHRTRQHLERFKQSVRWMLENCPKPPLNRAAILGPLIYVHPVAADVAERVPPALMTGADLSKGSPLMMLRNGIMSTEWKRDAPRSLSLRTLVALRAELHGERVTELTPDETAFEYFRDLHSRSDRQ